MFRMLAITVIYSCVLTSTIAHAFDIQCAVNKYQKFTTAQEQWQRTIVELIKNANPKLKDAANRYLSDQLNVIEMNRIAVENLLHTSPAKLRLDAPVTQWLVLDPDDKEKLSFSSRRYAELRRQTEVATRRPAHPDGDALRTLMRDQIGSSTEYQNRLKKLNDAIAEANRIVCGSLR